MKRYEVGQIRNLALVGHGGSGKTSLAEAMLFSAGVTDRLGRVDEGQTVMDYDPEEIKRRVSINASLAPCPWKGIKVNIVDTPGYFDFVGEVRAALRVVDAAMLVADAVAGVEVGTELTWKYAADAGLPRIVVINKVDRENANFYKVLDELKEAFGPHVVPLALPIGQESGFKGVVDLVREVAVLNPAPPAKDVHDGDIPAEVRDRVKEYREGLLEAAAENDDALLEKYLEGSPLTVEEIASGVRKGVAAGKLVPVVPASGVRNVGVQALLDMIVAYLPSPASLPPVTGTNPKTKGEEQRIPAENAPFSAFVFKTMADPYVGKLTLFRVYSGILKSDSAAFNPNRGRSERVGQLFIPKGKAQETVSEVSVGDLAAVAKLQETTTGDTLCDEANPLVLPALAFPKPVYSVAVAPKSKGDEEKIGSGLSRLAEEDPTFTVHKDPISAQIVISGLGDLHLEVICDRLRRKFGVEVTLEAPRIPYKETIRSHVRVEGRHKKQTGGRGQFGHVWLEMEPLPDMAQDFEFVDKVFGGAVPRQYIPAVEKGLREVLVEGVIAGYPVTGLRCMLVDGSYHTVDSSELAFKLAAGLAFKKGFQDANPVLLEPIVNVEVTVPDAYMGDVIGDLNKKRGRILGMESAGRAQVIRATVPQAEMARYAIDLRSITQGRGTFRVDFDHYEELPAHLANAVIEEGKKRQAKD
ncbi:MAG: elongation factor G [Bacillota bacterium]